MIFLSILRRFRDLGEENHSNSFLLLQLGYETDGEYYMPICPVGYSGSVFLYLREAINLLIPVFYRRGIKKVEELTLFRKGI